MSEKSLEKSRDIVLPGDVVGVIEEFYSGENVFERDGSLISTVAGLKTVDMEGRVVSVKPLKDPRRLSPGVFVYALVLYTRVDIAMTRILGTDLVNIYQDTISGILHISQIPSETRLRSVDDVVRPGDIIYAKIVSRTQPYFISMRSQRASIVVSLCPVCGSIMGRLRERLVCPVCGFEEERRPLTSYLYRLSELRPRGR